MTYVIDEQKDNAVGLLSYTHSYGYRMLHQWNFYKLIKLIKKGLHEIISKYHHKVYFDIDFKTDTKNIDADAYLNKLTDRITELFPNPDMAVSGNISEYTFSTHISLHNYKITNQRWKTKMQYIVQI